MIKNYLGIPKRYGNAFSSIVQIKGILTNKAFPISNGVKEGVNVRCIITLTYILSSSYVKAS